MRPPIRRTAVVNGFGAVAGGIVREHEEVARALTSSHQVFVASAPVGADFPDDVTILSRQAPNRRASWVEDLRASVRRRRYDLRVDTALAFRLNTPAARHVVIVNDINHLRPDLHHLSWQQRTYRTVLHQWALRRADEVVAISEQTRREVLQLVPSARTKTRVLQLPVSHLLGSGAHARPRRSQQDTGPVRLLTFGHARNKGVQHLLALMRFRDDVVLDVVCSDEVWRDLWSETASELDVLDRVTVRSGISDAELVTSYRSCDVFCMLSSYEGYGLPVAEALLHATPCVVSDIDILQETSRGYAVSADAGDPATLSAAVDEALARDPSYWAEASRDFATWTWAAFTTALVDGGAHGAA